jgi:AraC-like DNA-binding protein
MDLPQAENNPLVLGSRDYFPLSGLRIRVLDFKTIKPICTPYKVDETLLEFGALISGRVTGEIILSRRKKAAFKLVPGNVWCALCDEPCGVINYCQDSKIQALVVSVEPGLLSNLIDRVCTQLPMNCHQTYVSSPDINSGVMQLVALASDQVSNNLLVISKVLELLGLITNRPEPGDGEALRSDDIQRVRLAREILLSQMDNPPNLPELARLSGMCVSKLSMGFRQVFGETVYGLLRRERLQCARQLMEEEGKTVSEAAWTVGYNSLSSFSRAFTECYGVTPGYFARKRRKGLRLHLSAGQ